MSFKPFPRYFLVKPLAFFCALILLSISIFSAHGSALPDDDFSRLFSDRIQNVGGDIKHKEENNNSGFVLEHYENGNSTINNMVDVKDANDTGFDYTFEFVNCNNPGDSDSDGLPDGYEVFYGLNPSISTGPDGTGDFDGDGLSNLFEYGYNMDSNYSANSTSFNNKTLWYLPKGIYWGGLNPVRVDTDMDGLGDGKEVNGFTFNLYYYSVDGTLVTDSCVVGAGVLNPLDPDYDGDGLADGQEVNGWNVMIAYKSGDDMVTEERTYRTDPTVVQSSILDSDNDGLSDYVETGMCRLCDYHPDQIEDWKNTYPDLYSSYSWFIFDRAKKAYDDKLSETGNVSVAWQEYNNTLHSQFNPFVRESIPPIITDVHICSDVRYSVLSVEHCWTKISVTVQDVSGISSVKIGVTDRNRWKTFSEDDAESLGNNKYRFSTCIDIDYWGDYLVDYHVKVIVTDGGDNSISFEKKINGVFGGFLDFLGDIWNMIVGAVTAAVKAVVEVLNKIIEAMLNAIKAMLESIISPILSMIKTWSQSIASAMREALNELSKTNPNSQEHLTAAVGILSAAIICTDFFLLIGIMFGMLALEATAKVVPLVYAAFLPCLFVVLLTILVLVDQALPESTPTFPEGTPSDVESIWDFAQLSTTLLAFLTAVGGAILHVTEAGSVTGGVAVAMALAIAAFILYYASKFVTTETEKTCCSILGLIFSFGSLALIAKDMLKGFYVIFSIIAGIVTATAIVVGAANLGMISPI